MHKYLHAKLPPFTSHGTNRIQSAAVHYLRGEGCRAAHRVERAVREEGAPVRGDLRHRRRRRLLRAQLPRHALVSLLGPAH